MSGGLKMITEILLILFYFIIFYLIGRKYDNKKNYLKCLLVTLAVFSISSIYYRYFICFIENSLVREILRQNFLGLELGSFGFWVKKKR